MLVKQTTTTNKDTNDVAFNTVELVNDSTGENLGKITFQSTDAFTTCKSDLMLSTKDSAMDFVDLLKVAYEAGKAGEDFLFTQHDKTTSKATAVVDSIFYGLH